MEAEAGSQGSRLSGCRKRLSGLGRSFSPVSFRRNEMTLKELEVYKDQLEEALHLLQESHRPQKRQVAIRLYCSLPTKGTSKSFVYSPSMGPISTPKTKKAHLLLGRHRKMAMSRVVRKEGHGRQAEGMKQVHGRLLLLRGVPGAALATAQGHWSARRHGGRPGRTKWRDRLKPHMPPSGISNHPQRERERIYMTGQAPQVIAQNQSGLQ